MRLNASHQRTKADDRAGRRLALAYEDQCIVESPEEARIRNNKIFASIAGLPAPATPTLVRLTAPEWYGSTVYDDAGGISARQVIALRIIKRMGWKAASG